MEYNGIPQELPNNLRLSKYQEILKTSSMVVVQKGGQRPIQNPVKHLKWSDFFQNPVKHLKWSNFQK